uniref:Cadherin domain-containing protein n=1 Tax=Panagrolaimus sp. JU765 TaxID=591449 RepID=A0AC34Q5Z7_9BILA
MEHVGNLSVCSFKDPKRMLEQNQKFNIENERCLNSYCHADLVLKSPLDFESNPVEKVSIIARDGASLTKNSNERIGNLTINVVDEQDTPPTFLTTTSEPIRVAENLAIGSKVFQVNAIDGDRAAVKKNEVVYEIVGNSEYFQIDSVTGAVTLKKKLDRELSPRLNLAIMAVEQDDVHMNSEMMVEFIVEDSDDNPPQCSSKQYTAELNRTSKELNLGQVISVFDKDHGKNSQFDIKIGGEYSESFSVKPKKVQGNADLILSVVDFDSLEYVTDPEIILDLILTPRNGSKTEMITKCSIVIQLDSSAPKASLDSFQFKKQLFVVQIMENMPAPQVLANLTETSEHDVVFTIEGDGAALFSVNDESQFVTAETLDAEKARNYTLKITANQNGQIAAAKIQINVLDENDENPMFEKPHYIFNVTEETEATFYVKATDKDSPANSNVTYGIPDPVPDQVSINKKTGRIFVGKIDVEKLGSTLIEFNVTATDNGNPPLKSTAKVRVNVQDQNDNLPFFSKRAYSVILKCGTPMNSTVVKVKAMDMDLTGSKITYELPGEMQKYFQIDALTGIVILTRELPKAKREFHFNVIAKDGGNPPKQAVTRVSIRVEDCVKVTAAMEKFPTTQSPTPTKFTESTPMTTSTAAPEIPKEKKMINASKVFNKLDGAVRVFIPKHLTFDVEENAAFGTKIYKVDIQDEEYDFHFITQDLNQMNLIKMNKSGDLIVADKIDYEKVQFINGSIFARFNRRNLLYATVTIQIIDQNDNKPILRLPKDFVINLPQETEVGYVLDLPYPLAVDHDLSTSFSAIEYRILNEEQSFFMIDKVLSIIQLVKPLSDNVQLHIQAVDNPNGLDHNSVNYTLVVKVVKFLMPSTTPLPLDLTKNIFHSVPDEISVFEDEMIGSVLLVISVDEFKKTAVENNHILNATLPLVAVEVKNSDVVELANESELKLRKSLKGYVNQKLCIQLEAKIDTNSTVPQIFSKSVCFLVKPRPVAPIISFPIQNSIHKFKENTKYESLLTFNATSTILDPKMSALKFGIVETKTDVRLERIHSGF